MSEGVAGATRPLDRDATVYIAGHRGLVGSALWRRLSDSGFTRLVGASSGELDLTDHRATADFLDSVQPECVVIAAAKVGGIVANNTYPVDFLTQNLAIQTSILDAALATRVPRLLFLGSSCIYPRDAAQPIREDALLTGPLERTNESYAIAKIAGLMYVSAVRRQYGLSWISAMPTNLYGPGDNFSAETSHVLPALIRRYHAAAEAGESAVTNWGTGTPRREFMHVDDLASACLHLLDHYDGDSHVNVGVGEDIAIRDLADLVAAACDFHGATHWDDSYPDGTPRKLLDISILAALGWQPQIDLADGISQTVQWYRDHLTDLRSS